MGAIIAGTFIGGAIMWLALIFSMWILQPEKLKGEPLAVGAGLAMMLTADFVLSFAASGTGSMGVALGMLVVRLVVWTIMGSKLLSMTAGEVIWASLLAAVVVFGLELLASGALA